LKLLTLNCHSWLEESQWDKMKWIADAIVQNDYDVIALQEVNQLIDSPIVKGKMKTDNFAYVLLQELKLQGVSTYECHWDVSHIAYDKYEEGLAILTKHPIKEITSFYVTKNQSIDYWKSRKIVGAKVEINGQPITFYSCHFGWWNDEEEPFQYQINQLMKYINQEDWYFLMGDFNNDANKRKEGYDYVMKQNLYDTYYLADQKDEGFTVTGKIAGWDDNKEDLRIDYILTNRKVKVVSSNVIFNGKNKPIVSDHYGVEVEIPLQGK